MRQEICYLSCANCSEFPIEKYNIHTVKGFGHGLSNEDMAMTSSLPLNLEIFTITVEC